MVGDVSRLDRRPRSKEFGRLFALGFVYWLAFVLVLEPGNILRAGDNGLVLVQEVLRIGGASLIGAAVTPAIFAAVRRWPMEGPPWRRHAIVLAVASLLLAAGLIVVSCLLADRLLASEHRPLGTALIEEFLTNGPPVTFCVVGLVVIAHAQRFFKELVEARREKPAPRAPVMRIPVKARGTTILLDVDRIDWIETQGNYLALHEGETVHLIRESLANLEGKLDPRRFVRVHRRMIVAIDRIGEIKPLGAGDAALFLKTGDELRLSRSFRARVQSVME